MHRSDDMAHISLLSGKVCLLTHVSMTLVRLLHTCFALIFHDSLGIMRQSKHIIPLRLWPRPCRMARPKIHDLAKFGESLHWTYVMTRFGKPVFSLAMAAAFLASLVIIARSDRLELLRILTALVAGLSLLSLHALMEGILFPFRSTYFLWFIMVIPIVKAVHLIETQSELSTLAPFALALILALGAGVFARTHSQSVGAWQVKSRALVERIAATARSTSTAPTLQRQPGPDAARPAIPTGPFDPSTRQDKLDRTVGQPSFDAPRTGDSLLVENIGTDTYSVC